MIQKFSAIIIVVVCGIIRPAMSRTLSEPIPLPGQLMWPKQPLSSRDNYSQFHKQVGLLHSLDFEDFNYYVCFIDLFIVNL